MGGEKLTINPDPRLNDPNPQLLRPEILPQPKGLRPGALATRRGHRSGHESRLHALCSRKAGMLGDAVCFSFPLLFLLLQPPTPLNPIEPCIQRRFDNHLMDFSRVCVKKPNSFAKAELYTGLARMFRAFEFELVDVVRERDIDHVWAHIAGEPSKQGKGLRVRVARVVD